MLVHEIDILCVPIIPQPFSVGRNWLYHDFWAVISDLRYSGYKTTIVAPEPSVERVAEAVYSTGSKISADMLLRVLPWDSVVRPWG
jgi:hypothetical protein